MSYSHNCSSQHSITTRHVIYHMSLLQSKDSLHHNMISNMDLTLYINIWHSRVTRGTLVVANCGNLEMQLEAIVEGISVSHHCRHSVRQGEAGVAIRKYLDNRGRHGASGDTGTMKMEPATESIFLGDSGVVRHHLMIQNTHSIFPSSWSHAMMWSVHCSTQFVWLFTHS